MCKAPRVAATLLLLVLVAGCARVVPRPSETVPPPAVERPTLPEIVPPPPANALALGVAPGPMLSGVDEEVARRAFDAFRLSCPALLKRTDQSGLTAPEQWKPLCDRANAILLDGDASYPVLFFRDNFELVKVGEGSSFATGYYEPEIAGSRTHIPGYDIPIYAKPADLLDADPVTAAKGRGRVDETGLYTLYYERGEIDDGAIAGRGLEIAWAADPVDLFFLEIQGSGRLRLPDGSVMRIGYAGQNGREYVAVGRLLRERGLLQPPLTMQAVRGWLKANPEQGRALMRENKSYIFFRELTGPGPIGALNVPVTPDVTVAADPKFVPLGAPVLLTGMDNPAANGLWIAQDTGGAIRGANRFDTFWGAGAAAELTAGGMAGRGQAYLLLPRGTLERIRAGGATAQR